MDGVHPPVGAPRFFSNFPLRGSLLTALLLQIPTLAAGQSPADRVEAFLESASGFNLLAPVQEGVLSSAQEMVIPVTLLRGAEYMVVGYCDNACSDLDLALLDPSGEEVQADRLPDPEPILTLTAESTGSYEIHLTMVECPIEECGIALGVLGSTDEPGAAPGEDMEGRLTLIAMEMAGLGFSDIGEERLGALGNDQATSIPLTLERGKDYRIVGVCDLDCFHLDLALMDPTGVEVDSDFMDDDLPILALVPDTTGEYRLDVIMVWCGVEPCSYRVTTFAREEDTAVQETAFSGELVFHENHEGALEPEDDRLSGAYVDLYEVEVRPGQRIIADLRSEEFDTLLRILDPAGVGDENDDYGLEQGHSHIEKLALTEGTYVIQVTSFQPDSTGPYLLQIAIVEGLAAVESPGTPPAPPTASSGRSSYP